MTPTQRRWAFVGLAVLFACTPRSDRTEPVPDTRPAGSRIVVVFAPGLDAETLRGKSLRHLNALGTVKPLQDSVPGHPDATLATLYTGAPARTHGVFDGTIRVANSYMRTPSRAVRAISAADDLVRPASFTRAVETVPFWKTLGDTGTATSVLFAPNLMPVVDHGVRVLAGGLPSLTGERMDPMLFVRPGEAPSPVAESNDAANSVIEMTALSAGVWLAELPLVTLDESTLRSTIVLRERGDTVAVRAGERDFELRSGEHSPYLRLQFNAGRRSAVGQTRLHVLSTQPLRVLAEAVTVDPMEPAFSVSAPPEYAARLVGRAGRGPFGDSGVWNRRGGAAYAPVEFRVERLREEAEWRLRAAASELDGTDARVVVVHLDAFRRAKLSGKPKVLAPPPSPRRRGRVETPPEAEEENPAVTAALAALDEGVGMLRARLSDMDALLVIGTSQVSVASRALDLNGWLLKKRYLKLTRSGQVDWAKSQAYAAGDGGIYLNVRGREPEGSVPALRGGRLSKKIARELKGLRERGVKVVDDVWVADEDFAGNRRGSAPDVMVALADGYAVRRAPMGNDTIFVDLNTPMVSGPRARLDGVVLSSRPLAVDDPRLEDVAATALVFVGVSSPSAGRAWFAPPTNP